ncbi:exonuclease RecJ [Caloramator quimbayensis]|uniref:Single-stranded-DNA-specific exonuclease RecJ n=1 Tax=Caloramator quimbayensis TaxID=1147123 RepID=A0A1T4WV33_9CLOT|nr:exonuclease RecJ [Caloramator quimbayensis]
MEKWMLKNINADVKNISQKLGISEVLCRVLLNRGITDYYAAKSFIESNEKYMLNPILMKDIEKGVEIILDSIKDKSKIAVIGDYDVDGVISTFMLYSSLKRIGAEVIYEIPHRINDGYGINKNIIDKVLKEGAKTIITCDNGISAIEPINYAKEKGLKVVVTDHHDVPFEERDNERVYLNSNADAIINPKQMDCSYPFKQLCGAGVVLKFIQLLYEKKGIDKKESDAFIEYAAVATVCDVVDLTGENRIIVKRGLEFINNSKNIGLRSLIKVSGLENKKITTYHLGFIIGPCINATGRLDIAKKGVELLLTCDEYKALEYAKELVELNNERKNMTLKGVKEVLEEIENSSLKDDKIIVVYNKEIHESIAGIIAGRIKENYNKPTIVLTCGEECVKGSGRSIESYNIFEGLLKCSDILIKYGGHPMAAGLSLEEKNIELLRRRLNDDSNLTDEDLIRKITLDMHLPIDKITIEIAEELKLLEPFGKGNEKPLFGEKNVKLLRAIKIGDGNFLKFKLCNKENIASIDGLYFGDIDEFEAFVIGKYGKDELNNLYNGLPNNIIIDVAFNLDVNEYMGYKTVQLIIQSYR